MLGPGLQLEMLFPCMVLIPCLMLPIPDTWHPKPMVRQYDTVVFKGDQSL